jgi:pimeloyl-ACP methyl ester carboxylesterase
VLYATSLALLPLAAYAQAPFDGARFTEACGFHGGPLSMMRKKATPAVPACFFLHGYQQSHLRGHGNAGQPRQACAYDNSSPWTDDMAAVIKASGLVKPLVVAWSFGGMRCRQ